MNWYLEVLKKYAVFSGRARRKEYWMFTLFSSIITCVLVFVEGLTGSPGVVTFLYNLAVLIPGIAVSVRRLHDTNRSGWWFLISLIPLIGNIVVFLWVLIALILLSSIVLLVFMVQDSQPNENQYGSNPKAATATMN